MKIFCFAVFLASRSCCPVCWAFLATTLHMRNTQNLLDCCNDDATETRERNSHAHNSFEISARPNYIWFPCPSLSGEWTVACCKHTNFECACNFGSQMISIASLHKNASDTPESQKHCSWGAEQFSRCEKYWKTPENWQRACISANKTGLHGSSVLTHENPRLRRQKRLLQYNH